MRLKTRQENVSGNKDNSEHLSGELLNSFAVEYDD